MTSFSCFRNLHQSIILASLSVLACGGNDTAGVVKDEQAGESTTAGSSPAELEGGTESKAGQSESGLGGEAGSTESGGQGGTVGGNGTGGSSRGGVGTGGANGGSSGRGGSGTGGTSRGGASNGGSSDGGTTSGGVSNGGISGGGSSNGGTTSGGAALGGALNGGTSNGGTLSGGTSAGGALGGTSNGATGGLLPIGGTAGGPLGPVDETCTEGTVTFELQNFGAVSYCIASCGGGITIRPADSEDSYVAAFGLPNCYVGTVCETCEPVGCTDLECVPENLPLQRHWDGRFYGSAICGTSTSTGVSCLQGQCAPPGNYVARLCVSPCGTTVADTCMEIPFTYPTNSVVVLDPTFRDEYCLRKPDSDSSCLDSARPFAYDCQNGIRMPPERDCEVVLSADTFDRDCCAQ